MYVYNCRGESPPDRMGIMHKSQELTELPSFAIPQIAIPENGSGLSCRHHCGRWCKLTPVALLGLMVAIVLWGTAYKLSLYRPHPAPSIRVQMAKLWLEPRPTCVVPLRECQGLPHDRAHLYTLAGQNPPSVGLFPVSWSPDDLLEKQNLTAAFSIPSRSPPSFSLSLD
jgi:hypothetical protein